VGVGVAVGVGAGVFVGVGVGVFVGVGVGVFVGVGVGVFVGVGVGVLVGVGVTPSIQHDIYRRSFHGVLPSPILNMPVSDSKPGSAIASTGFVSCHS
jgi:hypothetical protein